MVQNNKAERIIHILIELFALFVIMVVMFKIFFYKEPFINLLRITCIIHLVILTPLYILISLKFEKMNLIERFSISLPLGFAILGILSYNLSLIGVHLKNQLIYILLFVYGIVILYYLFFYSRKI